MKAETLPDTLDALQDVVGGYVEPFFTLPSPTGAGSITGYVNEEGLMMGLPMAFGVVHSKDYIVPLAGDAVIVGLSDDGESRGLTPEEAALLTRAFRRGVTFCPVIEGEPADPMPLIPVRGMLVLPALATA
jgi:hypothetical protein